MEYAIVNASGETQIVLSGQLTFADSFKFKQIIEMLAGMDTRAVTLNFCGIDFIDSAGLGMLLLLRDECQGRNIPLSIVGAQGQVRKIFLISKFDQLFSMPLEGRDGTTN